MADDFKFNLSRLHIFLDKIGKEIVSEMKNRLRSDGSVASGHLEKSIKYSVTDTKDSVELDFTMAEYGEYVDQGRRPGKQPPISKIKQWCRIKGIPETAAYPIARKIGRFGKAGTYFFTIPIQRRRDKIRSDINKIMGGEFVKSLEDYIRKNKLL